MARALAVVGQSVAARITAGMRFDQIRHLVEQEFRDRLAAFKEQVAATGPVEGVELYALKHAKRETKESREAAWTEFLPGGVEGVVHDFLTRHGVENDLTPDGRDLLLKELNRAWQAYAGAALDHNKSAGSYDLSPAAPVVVQQPAPVGDPDPVVPYAEAVSRYMQEVAKLVPKTIMHKQEAFDLLGEITGHRPLSSLAKRDAREVRDILRRLPKNRSKMPATRGLTFQEMLSVPGTTPISETTANHYMSHYKAIFTWAVNNDLAKSNIFDNMPFKMTGRQKAGNRKHFNADQLALMFGHLIDPDSTLVRKDCHKWGVLIAMFTVL